MEALDNFVESNTHIVVRGTLSYSVSCTDLGAEKLAFSLVTAMCFSTVGLSSTAETTAASVGNIRIFQKTRGQHIYQALEIPV